MVSLLLLAPNVAGSAADLGRVPWEDLRMAQGSTPGNAAATGAYSANGGVSRTIKRLIACESHGKNVKIVDSNGYYSYGVLMFQRSTWDDFSQRSGITGDPMVPEDAVRMATWAIAHGYLGRWTCAHILGMV